MGIETAAVLGTLASLAGTGVSIAGAKAARDDANKAVEAQLAQQKGFQDRAKPIVAQSIEDSSAANASRQIQTGADAAQDMYKRLNSLPQGIGYAPIDPNAQARVDSVVGQQ